MYNWELVRYIQITRKVRKRRQHPCTASAQVGGGSSGLPDHVHDIFKELDVVGLDDSALL